MSTSRPRLVIFDMDGTLTLPVIDFETIRTEIGLEHEPILEAIARMSAEDRARADAILHRHEEEAAANSKLQPRATEVVHAIRSAGVPVALMTRNTKRSVATFLTRHPIEFDFIRTREDGPMKPAPDPVLDICRRFGVGPGESWVIGDFRFDIECGKAAGATTALLIEPGQRPDWAGLADHVVTNLDGLLPLMNLG